MVSLKDKLGTVRLQSDVVEKPKAEKPEKLKVVSSKKSKKSKSKK